MGACPDADALRRLLDGDPTHAGHVDGCAACLAALEALAATPPRPPADPPLEMTLLGRLAAAGGVRPPSTVPVSGGTEGPAPPAAVGPYTVRGELGRGGMGVVYLARHGRLRRLVALKLLHAPAPSADEAARFRTEAEAVARLQHPNIVQV